MRSAKPPRVASISIRTLLDCTYAISDPEKSPEKSMATMVTIIAEAMLMGLALGLGWVMRPVWRWTQAQVWLRQWSGRMPRQVRNQPN